MIRAVVALDSQGGLANDDGIPWQGKLPSDVKYYRQLINNGDAILMGYGLYKELLSPYESGVNYVAIDDPTIKIRDNFVVVGDARKFLSEQKEQGNGVWNMGGAGLFASTFDFNDELYITQLEQDFGCTKFFPEFKDAFDLASQTEPQTENGITFRFQVWKRKTN